MSDHSIHMQPSAEEEPPLDELLLPTPTSQVGRSSQWSSLLMAYRRAAGVPYEEDEEEPKRSSDGLSKLCEDEPLGPVDCDSSGAFSLNSGGLVQEATEQQPAAGYQLAVLTGPAGTGKSFLVQRLKLCMIESYQQTHNNNDAQAQADGCAASYHDDTTISTKSGGFLNSANRVSPKRNSPADLEQDETMDFAELPTGLFAQGSGSSKAPFAAFTEGFNQVLEQLICDALVDLDTLKLTLVDALGSEETLARLVPMVPHLLYILADNQDVGDRFETPEQPQPQDSGTTTLLMTTDSNLGIQYLLRCFTRALTKLVATYYGGPIVLFLEDAESMDAPSAALLQSLAQERESHNLLLVLAVGSEQPVLLHDSIRAFQETKRCTDIPLDNLTPEQVHTLVTQALRRPTESSIQPLCDHIYQRTHGNCFFVVELLRSLKDKNLLQFNFDTLQWTYDIPQILQAETTISDNNNNDDDVLDLVTQKLQTLSKEARYVLVMASCLDSTIELEVLAKIVLDYYPKDGRDKWDSWVADQFVALHHAMDSCPETIVVEMDVLLQLDSLVACGLMERVLPAANSPKAASGNVFSFAHERIRQAAASFIPVQEVCGQLLHVRVGELLREIVLMDTNHSPPWSWMLFRCLDHLNKAPDFIVEEHRLELAQLNRQAGENAVELSAFLPAVTYFEAGIQLLLQKSRWNEEETVLLLCLRTQLSICHYRTGNLMQSKRVAQQVLASPVALEDKLPLYYNLIAVYKAQGKLEEAVNIGMELLTQAGEKFSNKPGKLRLAVEKSKVQKLLKQHSDQQLIQLPRCTNELKGAAINVYAILFDPLSHLGCPPAVDLLRLRSIYLTMKYGSTDASALAFAYYASHLISQGDLDGGYRFGKISMDLLKKAETQELTSRTIMVANFLSLHWKEPLRQTLDRLLKGYNLGMINGDIEMAFTNAGLYQTHYFYVGLPLPTGEKDLSKFIHQMEEYGQHTELSQCKPLWQTMLNLMGRGHVDPTIMSGEAMNMAEFEGGKQGVVVMKSYRMQLAYYFDKLELAQSLMEDLRPHSNSSVAPFFQIARRFFFGLIRLGMARKAPERKRSVLLKKIVKEDVDWLEARVRRGAVNCLHKLWILKAELATFDSSQDKIGDAYDKAVVTSRSSGFSQDEALANELAASYFLSVGSFQRASNYLSRAHELYQAWGVAGKVKQLEEKYVLIKGGGSSLSLGGSVGGSARSTSARSRNRQRFKQRFSTRLSDTHKTIDSSDALSVLSSEAKSAPERRHSKSDTALTSTSSAAAIAMATAA